MARRKKTEGDEMSPDMKRLHAKWWAMQKGKEEDEKRRGRLREFLESAPGWLRPGLECVEVNNGTEFFIKRIDNGDNPAVVLTVTKFNGAEPDDAEAGWLKAHEVRQSPVLFVDRINIGLVVARGVTPDTLRFGFQFYRPCMWDGKSEYATEADPGKSSTGVKVMERYNALKPAWR